MKKVKTLMAFFLVFAILCLTSCGEKNDKTTYKEITISEIESNNSGLIENNGGHTEKNTESEYNSLNTKNLLVKEIHFEGYRNWTQSYEYDDGNCVFSKKSYYYASESFNNLGSLDCWYEMKYNESGKVAEQIEFDNYDGSAVSKEEYEYDESGKIKIIKNYSDYVSNPDYYFYYKYEYDENNNLISRYPYSKYGELIGSRQMECEYEYLENGNMIKTTCYYQMYDDIRNIEYKEAEEYDINGKLVKTIYYECDYPKPEVDVSGYSEYEYDKNGNVTKRAHCNADGEVEDISVYSYTYNEKGDMIKKTLTSGNGSGYTENYEYDRNGNLVKYSKLDWKEDKSEVIIYIYSDQDNKFNDDSSINLTDFELINTSASSSEWKQAYVDYIDECVRKNDLSGANYLLLNINNDNIPELYINFGSASDGAVICSYYNGNVIEQSVWPYGLSYIAGKNVFCISGGRMLVYFEKVYSIVDGEFVVLFDGNYGVEDNSNVNLDEEGYPIYNYYCDGVLVDSKSEYIELLNKKYDESIAFNPFESAEFDRKTFRYIGNGICNYDEILEKINKY